MDEEKKIKIMIEVPSKWIDYESPLLGLGHAVRHPFERILRDAILEKVLGEIDIPKIDFTKEELKQAVIDKMAERVVDKHNENI